MIDFEAKRNALFACLDASIELKGTVLDQTSTAINPLKRNASGNTEIVYRSGGGKNHSAAADRVLKNLRGKESMFKKPELPIARCLKPRSLPDYQVIFL